MSITSIDTATTLPQKTVDSRAAPAESKAVVTSQSGEQGRIRAESQAGTHEVKNQKVDSNSSAAQTENTRVQQQREKIDEAIERASQLDHRLSFQVDEQSGKSVVVVRDAQTSEILKQFPSEQMLNVARRLEEHLDKAGDGAGVLHADEA